MVGNVILEGRIMHLSAADLRVRLIKPFCSSDNYLHIPYFARPFSNFLINDYGEKRAKDLLVDIYLKEKDAKREP